MKNARKEEVKKEIIMSGLLLKNWIENGKNKVPNNIQGLEDIRNLFAETVEPKEHELVKKSWRNVGIGRELWGDLPHWKQLERERKSKSNMYFYSR